MSSSASVETLAFRVPFVASDALRSGAAHGSLSPMAWLGYHDLLALRRLGAYRKRRVEVQRFALSVSASARACLGSLGHPRLPASKGTIVALTFITVDVGATSCSPAVSSC